MEFCAETYIEEGKKAGFTEVHEMDADTIVLRTEVRDMCAVNSCGKYGASWACPPGCGSLEECEEKIRKYKKGIIVQTVGQLEDSMDIEAMMDTEKEHKEHFMTLLEVLRKDYPELLALSTGTCTVCKKCSYPDEPCRFPEKAFSSMEAFGMVVSDTCTANNVKYNYGPNTIAYTSCYLLY